MIDAQVWLFWIRGEQQFVVGEKGSIVKGRQWVSRPAFVSAQMTQKNTIAFVVVPTPFTLSDASWEIEDVASSLSLSEHREWKGIEDQYRNTLQSLKGQAVGLHL